MQTIVGVLRGGPSREHDLSLRSGGAMLANLPEERFIARDIYIDRKGIWHDRGRATTPERALRQLDVVLIGLHGEYGEDGGVQKLLARFGVPHTGADPFGSYLATHKLMAKMRAKEAGLLTPGFYHVERPEESEAAAQAVIRTFHQPVVVKPVGWGSSIGISIVGGYAPVLAAIDGLFSKGAPGVIVEEYIRGKEASVGVVGGLRDEALYALPATEITPPAGDFFSYDVRRSGTARETCPGNFSRATAEELGRAAKAMHRALGLRHYSQSDFIVTPKGIYYLETDALPEMTAESLMPRALASVGIPFSDFLGHLVNLTLSR